jgi:hypothetical protein
MRFNMDIISPGLFVGYAANRVPIVVRQKDVRSRPVMSGIKNR